MLTGEQWFLVVSMAAVLFLTRIAGFIIAGRLPDSRRIGRMLDVLPGITMVSIVLPAVVATGVVGIFASVVVAGVVMRTRSLGLAILLGVGLVTLVG